jgi:hypothetical protein
MYIAIRFPEALPITGCLMPTIVGINFGYIAGLAEFQRDAYRKWYAGNEQAMLTHLYSIDPALWKAAIWVIGTHIVLWGFMIILMLITVIAQIAP